MASPVVGAPFSTGAPLSSAHTSGVFIPVPGFGTCGAAVVSQSRLAVGVSQSYAEVELISRAWMTAWASDALGARVPARGRLLGRQSLPRGSSISKRKNVGDPVAGRSRPSSETAIATAVVLPSVIIFLADIVSGVKPRVKSEGPQPPARTRGGLGSGGLCHCGTFPRPQ